MGALGAPATPHCCFSCARTRSSYIPFRESKLTKLFQAFFCGRGKASMMVNINQCASTYDETLHVMRFSAVAKQVSPLQRQDFQDFQDPRAS